MLRDKVINMELDAFHKTLVICSFKFIKVEGRKTNMLGRMLIKILNWGQIGQDRYWHNFT